MDSEGKRPGYRRLARIVFLTGRADGLAGVAAEWARAQGAEWMEARARRLPGVEAALAVYDEEDRLWADLLVTLDAAALSGALGRRAGLQHRHYPFEPADGISGNELEQAVRRRVEGMLGGLRLMQRAAQDDED